MHAAPPPPPPVCRVGLCLDCLAAVGCAGEPNLACVLYSPEAGERPGRDCPNCDDGPVCDCQGCQERLARLERGERRNAELGTGQDLTDWSPENGATWAPL